MSNSVKQVCNIQPNWGHWDNPQNGRVYDTHGIAPTMRAMSGGGAEVKVLVIEP